MKFHKSIAYEINALKDRARNLIGSKHWGEEGRYKEAVLRSVIRRFLPSNVSLGNGFVIDKRDEGSILSSRQIDIIVYYNTYPLLFSEGDFVITTPADVRGIIEVKTRISHHILKEAISAATEIGHMVDYNNIFSSSSKLVVLFNLHFG